MKINKPTQADFCHVAFNMRERDVEELAALYPVDGRGDVAEIFITRYARRPEPICGYREDGKPVAIGLAVEHRKNVLTLGFIATEDFKNWILPMAKYIRRELFRPAQAAGCHRIETTTIDGYDETHRWLGMLGLHREATHPGFGKRGETFHTYAWVKDVRSVGDAV